MNVSPPPYDGTMANKLGTSRLTMATVRAVAAEEDTDWAPDPWHLKDFSVSAGMFLPAPSELNGPERLKVAFLGGRSRLVPILDPWTRLAFHQATTDVLGIADQRLSPSVLAYRMAEAGRIEHYRSALVRRRDVELTYATEYPVGLVVDIASFFPSVSLDLLDEILHMEPGWMRVRTILTDFHRTFGYVLPEGYGAARALGNMALLPLDGVIVAPYTRWVDDYRIFCRSKEEAHEILGAMSDQAEAMGLRLSRSKTRIVPTIDFTLTTSSVIEHHVDELDGLGDSTDLFDGASNERRLRLILRIAAEHCDTRVLAHVEALGSEQVPATVLPRLSWLLAASPWTSTSTKIVSDLIQIDDDLRPWRLVRLAAAIWYAPAAEARELIDLACPYLESDEVLRPLLARLVARHCPERLGGLRYLSDTDAWKRAFSLGQDEIRARSGEGPDVVSGIGPPVASYL
jgi:hypothetical protein